MIRQDRYVWNKSPAWGVRETKPVLSTADTGYSDDQAPSELLGPFQGFLPRQDTDAAL